MMIEVRMRVISGSAKGIRLNTIEGLNTRPTTDRVKESLFNLIQFYVRDSKVLDLFAGSGGLGLECASRGAEHITAVDNNPKCIKVIKENYDKTKLNDKVTVIQGDMIKALSQLSGQQFDLVILDPPYKKGFEERAVRWLLENGMLSERGVIIIEHALETKIEDGYEGLKLMKQKKYGSTMVSVLEEA